MTAAVASHQTIRLSRGGHRSPQDGACVMELASMLAGERFTDHPRTACPVIAGVLRLCNDLIDDEGRQELIPYASAVVGTRAPRAVVRRRADRCIDWAQSRGPKSPRWRGLGATNRANTAIRTVAACWRFGGHRIEPREFIELVDELLAIDAATVEPALSMPARRSGRAAPRPRADDPSSGRAARQRRFV